MPTNTYVALDRVTATAAANVSFTSIPATYTDLILVAVAKSSVTGSSVNNYRIRFNNDTTSVYSNTAIRGDGSTATSVRDANQNEMYMAFLSQTSAQAETSIFNIMNYSNSTTNKTVLARGGSSSGGFLGASVGLWRKTDVINRLDIYGPSGETVTGTFSLYGIKAQATPGTAKATGGTISYDNFGNVYHTFTSTGTFTPSVALSCDALVIAGGGGGSSGGGGAGGFLEFTSQSLSTATTVTVGGGGAGGAGANSGTVGVDSQLGALTLVKGGGFGGDLSVTGGNGGSGGGGGAAGGGTFAGGTATSGQGNNGGSQAGQTGAPYPSGGGGGAGTVGGNASGSTAGSGGAGLNTYSSWASVTSTGVSGFYAGGGGGSCYTAGTNGSGGSGGGGAGTGVAGTTNTGSGGGGRTDRLGGGAGGSGIVIIRYQG